MIFDKINQVLAVLVGGVQRELTEKWLLVGGLNLYLGSVAKVIINFSMEESREAAGSFAETLVPLSDAQRKIKIKEKSHAIASFLKVIAHPGFVGSLVIILIRLGERGTTRQRIEILE